MKVSTKQYAQALYELTKDKSNDEVDVIVEKFIANLQSEQKLNSIEQIIKQFVEIYNKANNVTSAKIFTGREIDENTGEGIKKALKKQYGADQIEMEMKVDKKLKGGIKIVVGEDILDNSILGKLSKLRSNLVR